MKCQTIKNHGQKFLRNVTLMCHCDENEVQCHRHVLKEIILSGMV